MCGIAGCLQRGVPPAQLTAGLDRMLRALAHRGPDDRGIWLDANTGLAIGHRRLSIRDLSVAGHQPMFTDDGQWGLAYNGEIYNADELRRQLGHDVHWHGTSDTEVLLQAIARWGLSTTLTRAAGMFAIALWNRARQTVTLIRDRLGIKPLYYSIQDGQMFWASELKALLAHPSYRSEINPDALRRFLQFGYVPAPHCILRRTWKLLPGRWLEVNLSGELKPQLQTYWDSAEAAIQARHLPSLGDEEQVVEQTRELLGRIVGEHLAADVPLGAFLSGGIDSSLIVAMTQAGSAQPIKTFSIGFHDPAFDEAPHARAVAAALGTEHYEHYVGTHEVAEYVPHWAEYYCEPFSDTSSLPSLIVCREARQHVTVALTGDGGDELFAGYRRYQQTIAISQRMRNVPRAVRGLLRALLAVPPSAIYDRLHPLQRLLAGHVQEGLAESVRKTRSLLAADDDRRLYECLASISFNANASGLVAPTACLTRDAFDADVHDDWQADWRLLENMQLWDSRNYLPNDILHKVDIASMAVGLEVRVPMLDHRFFEHAWRVPDKQKADSKQGKLLLRRLLRRSLPPALFDRPKRGFSAFGRLVARTATRLGRIAFGAVLRDSQRSTAASRRAAVLGGFDVAACWSRPHLARIGVPRLATALPSAFISSL